MARDKSLKSWHRPVFYYCTALFVHVFIVSMTFHLNVDDDNDV